MTSRDEPLLGEPEEPTSTTRSEALVTSIRRLVTGEAYAVLCTQGERQPYGSIVAYAFSDDLSSATFATPITTRKFRLLAECPQVALVIDNRARFPDDMMRVESITVTGRAVQLAPGPEREHWAARLIARHPYLESFVAAATSALFRVDVARFLHVVRFQEVRQWIPPRAG
jgi:nitroimidazol reductase NimA-like FMN-containing flavoprotein (pyridoxamine 5'-phosphate oxidase superfamily)